MKKYRFVGDGMGVPGLPHELTEVEAESLGMVEILEEAVKNGNYVVSASQTIYESKAKAKDNKQEVKHGQ